MDGVQGRMYKEKDRYPTWEETKELLSKLVRTDTCQPSGNEEILVRTILKRLKGRARYEVVPHGEKRASLIVKLPGKCDEGGIVFAGHLDTVAWKGNTEWKYPPHSAVVRGNRLYGRGAADMKGGIAAMLLTAEYLLDKNVDLKKTVYFCFTADEENQGIGAVTLAAHPWLLRAGELIICEPTNLKAGCCEKGALWLLLNVKGVSAHGSAPKKGINALEYAMELAVKIKEMVKDHSPSHPYLGSATAAVTGIQSGSSVNVIPDMARAVLDIRTVPESLSNAEIIRNAKQYARELMQAIKGLEIEVQVLNDRPSLENPADSGIAKRMSVILGRNKRSSEGKGIHYYTDASQLVPALSLPFLILGPGREDQMHCIDESVDIEEVREAVNIYLDYILEDQEERGEVRCHKDIKRQERNMER